MRSYSLTIQGRLKAFTLIEVLVVVAIIALLVAILLPSLGRARQQAKLNVCRHNHKMLGLGAMQYANEFREYIPPTDPSRKDIGPMNNKTYYGVGVDCMGVYFPRWGSMLELFVCPGAGNRVERGDLANIVQSNGGAAGPNGMVDDLEEPYTSDLDKRKGMCYEYIPLIYNVVYYPNGVPQYKEYNLKYDLSIAPQVRPLRLNLVKNSSSVVIAHDADEPGRNWHINDPEDPHGSLGRGNMLFADGHADAVIAKEWTNWTDRGRPRVLR